MQDDGQGEQVTRRQQLMIQIERSASRSELQRIRAGYDLGLVVEVFGCTTYLVPEGYFELSFG